MALNAGRRPRHRSFTRPPVSLVACPHATHRRTLAARRCLTQPPPGLPQGGEPVTLDPAQFTTRIDNPYWPMRPGTRWVSRETAPDGTRQKVVVRVTHRTRLIANGVTARVVRDTVTERRPARRGHARLVRPGRGRGPSGTSARDEGVRARRAGRHRGLVRGRRRRRAGRRRRARGPRPGHALPPGVLRRPRRGPRVGREPGRAGRGARRALSGTSSSRGRRTRSSRTWSEYKFLARGVGPVLALEISGGAGREELLRMGRAALASQPDTDAGVSRCACWSSRTRSSWRRSSAAGSARAGHRGGRRRSAARTRCGWPARRRTRRSSST